MKGDEAMSDKLILEVVKMTLRVIGGVIATAITETIKLKHKDNKKSKK
jgi:uncharacterized protein (DUF697 family)